MYPLGITGPVNINDLLKLKNFSNTRPILDIKMLLDRAHLNLKLYLIRRNLLYSINLDYFPTIGNTT